MTRDYKRPESVLVVIYTAAREVLLLERREPAGYWQSVTGSLHRDETPWDAAIREVQEETGLSVQDRLVDCAHRSEFEILPAWRSRYAPDVDRNTEHLFLVELPEQVAVELNRDEHVRSQWLSARAAALRASSHTNQAAIERFVLGD